MAAGFADGPAGSSRGGVASELEIEKKFAIPDGAGASDVERSLSSLGFVVARREEFADWYFDLPAPHWQFTVRDCWIRYRERRVKAGGGWGWRGAWQVKRGRGEQGRGAGDGASDGMTVYQELQGKDAKELILEMLSGLNDGERADDGDGAKDSFLQSSGCGRVYNGYDIPYLAGAERLVPFARLETFRTSYQTSNDTKFSCLKVDIDKTDFGYRVGEVECVLECDAEDEEQVNKAKETINKLVDLITSENSTSGMAPPTFGKLEHYLINNHRDHYDACVNSGVMMN